MVETEIAIEEFDNAAVYITFLYSLKTKISGIKLLFQKVFSTNIISIVQFSIFGLLIICWDEKNGITFLLPCSKLITEPQGMEYTLNILRKPLCSINR